ncbi:MAG: AmmeMemoRadiSam system protein A [Oscillospiraceae bacterium]
MPIVSAICVPHPPIILPDVGRGEEAQIAPTAAAYDEAARFLLAQSPESVILISPHAELYADAFHLSAGDGGSGSFAPFGAPQLCVSARYDEALCNAIAARAEARGLPVYQTTRGAKTLDHGSSIPLWFLQKAGGTLPVVRIGLSGLSPEAHYRVGQCLAEAAGEKRVAVVASGDLSHRLKADGPYGFRAEGPQLDKQITAALAGGDFAALLGIEPQLAEAGAECGLRAFVMMAGALDDRAVDARLLSYQDTFGVGYAVATLLPGPPDATRHFLDGAAQNAPIPSGDAYVQLARQSVESWVRHRRRLPLPQQLPPELASQQAGVFVSLHKNGQLRGCIGTIAPTTPSVAQEIIQNAVSAAAEDPRFLPVTPEELPVLEVHVDVLAPPEDIAGPEALDVRRYGVIVSSRGRRGLLLPDLEGVDTVQQQVDIARQKAGIAPGAPVQLQRFEVIRHE